MGVFDHSFDPEFFLMLFSIEFDVTVFDVPVFDVTLLYLYRENKKFRNSS